jgi:hypothetical protein
MKVTKIPIEPKPTHMLELYDWEVKLLVKALAEFDLEPYPPPAQHFLGRKMDRLHDQLKESL